MPDRPLIALDTTGNAPVISYNVPEPTSYTGRNVIAVPVKANFFKAQLRRPPASTSTTKSLRADETKLKTAVEASMKTGFRDSSLFPNVKLNLAGLKLVTKPNPGTVVESDMKVSPALARLDSNEVVAMLKDGKRLNVYRSLSGRLRHNYVSEPERATPEILIVETYRLSSFLGQYGAGRTIKTFSLLPGEKTKISVNTYRKTESDRKSSSSILDSYTEESAEEFESSVQSENSSTENTEKSFSYYADAEAQASWGWGSASVSGGVSGSTNASREEFAKNVSSSTEKHAASASAKRDVQIETSYEVKEQTGEETSTEREIQNINVSRTLNFVFRQMNQEFVTILHLVDIRIAFFNGFAESRREVPLPEMDSLLTEVLNTPAQVAAVRADILDALKQIRDYRDRPQNVLDQVTVKERGNKSVSYWRFKRGMTSTYRDPATGTEVDVPGVILAADKNVLRTEGVIVEALLGQGEALDEYSHGIQEQTVRDRKARNDVTDAEAEKVKLGVEIVRSGDATAAGLYATVFPPGATEEEAG